MNTSTNEANICSLPETGKPAPNGDGTKKDSSQGKLILKPMIFTIEAFLLGSVVLGNTSASSEKDWFSSQSDIFEEKIPKTDVFWQEYMREAGRSKLFEASRLF
jgi:hypothetical protein